MCSDSEAMNKMITIEMFMVNVKAASHVKYPTIT